jgi:hypothetical protein
MRRAPLALAYDVIDWIRFAAVHFGCKWLRLALNVICCRYEIRSRSSGQRTFLTVAQSDTDDPTRSSAMMFFCAAQRGFSFYRRPNRRLIFNLLQTRFSWSDLAKTAWL